MLRVRGPGANGGLGLRASEDLWFQNPPPPSQHSLPAHGAWAELLYPLPLPPYPSCLVPLQAAWLSYLQVLGGACWEWVWWSSSPDPAHRWAWRK